MNIKPGKNTSRPDIKDLVGGVVYRTDAASGVSAFRHLQATVMQMGDYTLGASGVAFVTFPSPYRAADLLRVFVTPKTHTYHSLDSFTTSGFTVSGTATSETGNWLSLGYR